MIEGGFRGRRGVSYKPPNGPKPTLESLFSVTVLTLEERKTILASYANWRMTPAQRGLAEMQKMRFDLAQKSFAEAVQQNPQDAEALYSLGWALQAQGRDDEALTHYSRAAGVAKNQPALLEKVYTNSGAIYVKRHQLDQAADAYQMALTINPNQNDARFQYGTILAEKGLKAEALAQFHLVTKADPSHAAAIHQIAELAAGEKKMQGQNKRRRTTASVKRPTSSKGLAKSKKPTKKKSNTHNRSR